jgi:hypothetical protein
MSYNPYQMPMMPTTQQAQGSGIQWVQGENGAKAYTVGAGQSVLLMDSENDTFFIKSADQSGMPLPLRIFDYKERKGNDDGNAKTADFAKEYVTKAEFDEFKRKFEKAEVISDE